MWSKCEFEEESFVHSIGPNLKGRIVVIRPVHHLVGTKFNPIRYTEIEGSELFRVSDEIVDAFIWRMGRLVKGSIITFDEAFKLVARRMSTLWFLRYVEDSKTTLVERIGQIGEMHKKLLCYGKGVGRKRIRKRYEMRNTLGWWKNRKECESESKSKSKSKNIFEMREFLLRIFEDQDVKMRRKCLEFNNNSLHGEWKKKYVRGIESFCGKIYDAMGCICRDALWDSLGLLFLFGTTDGSWRKFCVRRRKIVSRYGGNSFSDLNRIVCALFAEYGPRTGKLVNMTLEYLCPFDDCVSGNEKYSDPPFAYIRMCPICLVSTVSHKTINCGVWGMHRLARALNFFDRIPQDILGYMMAYLGAGTIHNLLLLNVKGYRLFGNVIKIKIGCLRGKCSRLSRYQFQSWTFGEKTYDSPCGNVECKKKLVEISRVWDDFYILAR